MNRIRERVKKQLPMVLLTLLSIVQALALELLWTFVRENDFLFENSVDALVTWIQLGTNFVGIVVIWVVYASTAMRFRWIPTTSDSIYPFIVGVLEFSLVELSGPATLGPWFICMATIFGLMTWVTHRKMRRARRDEENSEFFEKLAPAKPRDFLSAMVFVTGFVLIGIYASISDVSWQFAAVALVSALTVLLWQLASAARFWQKSLDD